MGDVIMPARRHKDNTTQCDACDCLIEGDERCPECGHTNNDSNCSCGWCGMMDLEEALEENTWRDDDE